MNQFRSYLLCKVCRFENIEKYNKYNNHVRYWRSEANLLVILILHKNPPQLLLSRKGKNKKKRGRGKKEEIYLYE